MGKLQINMKSAASALGHQFLNASENRGMMVYVHIMHYLLRKKSIWHCKIVLILAVMVKPKSYRIAIHENDSLWDLRVVTGNKTTTFPELVKVYFNGTFSESKNPKTVAQLVTKKN